jgi:DNA (cytosine-5)-methyltransferase 1
MTCAGWPKRLTVLSCKPERVFRKNRQTKVQKVPGSGRRIAQNGRHRGSVLGQKRYTVASLFAGMGAFCKAFRDEGFEVLWANENDRFAVETYQCNFPETKLYTKSIEDLSAIADKLKHVDVMTGGFPCQPFSVGGSKEGFIDKRGRLVFEIIRLLRELGTERPKILLLENVPYLLNHDRGRTFTKIVQEIQQSGYWFLPTQNCAVLDTRIHTNIPQQRERLYMAALSWEHFDTNEFRFPDPVDETRDYREFLDLDVPAEDWCYFPADSKWGQMFQVAMESGDPERVYHLRRHYVREIKRPMIPTLTANMGDGGHNIPVIRDKWGIRKLTVRECLRLQGITEGDILFPKDLSRSQQYKQIGNAVTVPLVHKLATECRRQLDRQAKKRFKNASNRLDVPLK